MSLYKQNQHNNSFKWWSHTPVWITEAELNPQCLDVHWLYWPRHDFNDWRNGCIKQQRTCLFFFHPFSFCLPVWPRCDSVACSSILFSVTIYLEDMNTKKGKRKVKINETSRGVSLWLRLFIFAFHPKQEMECNPCRIEVQPIIIMTLWCSGLLIPQYRCGMALQVDNLI